METPRTQLEGCTCGQCYAEPKDNGNADYGQVWSERRGTYVARNCPVARVAASSNRSLSDLVLDGTLRRA